MDYGHDVLYVSSFLAIILRVNEIAMKSFSNQTVVAAARG